MIQEPLGTIAATGAGPEERTDEELMRAILSRDPAALAQLYDRYSGVAKAVILRIIQNDAEAEDLLQETYMEVWNHAANYSAEHGKPLGWIVTLSRRRALERLRQRASRPSMKERTAAEAGQLPAVLLHKALDASPESSGMRQTLSRIIAGLPEAQQQALELAFFKGMTQREIAAHTNVPLATVKSCLELGLRQIADGLKGIANDL